MSYPLPLQLGKYRDQFGGDAADFGIRELRFLSWTYARAPPVYQLNQVLLVRLEHEIVLPLPLHLLGQ
jgi:hypothetical protein